MEWKDWVDTGTLIGGFATGVGVGIAGAALWFAKQQVTASLKASREAAVVMTVQEWMTSPDMASRHRSHSPAITVNFDFARAIA